MQLTISQLAKTFDKFTALHNISLEISQGEFVALLGPSGCGKTTLLRLIAGFIRPTRGEIRINDRLYSDAEYLLPIEQRQIGMVFQSFALWPHMTVREHLAFPLKNQRSRLDKVAENALIDSTLAIMELDTLAEKLPGELSGGQKQRVSLARAIILKPPLLLMDEPLSSLDAELRVAIRREIQHIHQLTGSTIIYVTHDQSEALAMADRIIVMKDGLIEQDGTPFEVYHYPQTPFAASFVGKYNLLPGVWNRGSFSIGGHTFAAEPLSPYFVEQGLCPARPEQLVCTDRGIPVTIINRQYAGREFTYIARDTDNNLYRFYDSLHNRHEPGNMVELTYCSNK